MISTIFLFMYKAIFWFLIILASVQTVQTCVVYMKDSKREILLPRHIDTAVARKSVSLKY